MSANDIVRSRSAARHVYGVLKLFAWAAWTSSICYLCCHWTVAWNNYIAPNAHARQNVDFSIIAIPIWMYVVGIVIMSVGFGIGSSSSITEQNAWNDLIKAVKKNYNKVSVLGAACLGLCYILLVPHIILSWILCPIILLVATLLIPIIPLGDE